MTYPVILLSHRRREFLETTCQSLERLNDAGRAVVVDDSGDSEHHEWMEEQGYEFSCSNPDGSQVGYLGAMQTVWEVARSLDSDYVLLWEEDFRLTERIFLADMAHVMSKNPGLAQLNLQRQAVYKIEKRLGYMQSHQRRGYGLRTGDTDGIRWVYRTRPFTTNPSLVRREIFDIDWPTRVECDATPGGAEPAMSVKLERLGYHFGWLGLPNHPQTEHLGTAMKTGKGY